MRRKTHRSIGTVVSQAMTLVLLPLVALNIDPAQADALPAGFTEQTVFSGLE